MGRELGSELGRQHQSLTAGEEKQTKKIQGGSFTSCLLSPLATAPTDHLPLPCFWDALGTCPSIWGSTLDPNLSTDSFDSTWGATPDDSLKGWL